MVLPSPILARKDFGSNGGLRLVAMAGGLARSIAPRLLKCLSVPLARPDRLTACRHGQPKSPTIIFPADPLIRWDDQKVVNFEQILFANGRMLDLTEGARSTRPGLQCDFLTGTHPGIRCPRSETCRAKGTSDAITSNSARRVAHASLAGRVCRLSRNSGHRLRLGRMDIGKYCEGNRGEKCSHRRRGGS